MFPKHPTYTHSYDDWVKYRDILEGGDAFVQKYLRQLTMTESNPDYFLRRALSYNPAFAKSALVDIKNSIVQRMPDIHRTRGPTTYESAVLGQNRGVSGLGDSMNSFLSKEIILELLGMGKVGVFVDREALPETPSLSDVAGKHPYMYPYRAEQILNWTYSADNILDKLLLSHCEYTYDPEYGLVTGLKEVYRLFEKSSIGVKITDFEVNTKETTVLDSRILDLDEIPFVIFELEYSLLNDIADYQIALLNLCSTDLLAAIKSGSMYVEQYDPDNETEYLRPAPETVNNPQQTGTGTEFQGREPDKARNKEMITGGVRGRRYSRGLNAPEFISPSMDPLRTSLSLRDTLKMEIRQLVHLNVAGLSARSNDIKMMDVQAVEAGLATIGTALQTGERRIGEIWTKYEGSKTYPLINYPTTYAVTTTAQRIETATDLEKLSDQVPSVGGKKAIAKKVIDVLFTASLPEDELSKIYSEIDKAPNIVSDSTSLKSDVELGLVDNETASEIRGYPKGSVEKAKKDRAERIAATMAAQTKPGQVNPGARGNKDLVVDPQAAKNEKKLSKEPTVKGPVPQKARGNARY